MSSLPSLGPRGEGWLALQGVCFALVAAARWSAPPPPDGSLALVLRLAAYTTAVVGAAMVVFGIIQLRGADALAAVPRPLAGGSLVVSGAYRLVRHPIYGGLILVALALAIDRPWAGSFMAAALLAIVLDLKRRREELWLAQRYPEYPEYRQRTRALIPFLY
jgi:protein-S-isoprenylcysteine O-methyltransferase Ste14